MLSRSLPYYLVNNILLGGIENIHTLDMSRAGVTRTVNKVQKVRENKTEQGQTWPCRSRNVYWIYCKHWEATGEIKAGKIFTF